ncbi:cytochrome c [Devosia sp. 2618]|uniref:c-type cytochrome n=1 Tax=Devosia sp. 2618 TaxID=3156454 RepID=UPI00339967AC
MIEITKALRNAGLGVMVGAVSLGSVSAGAVAQDSGWFSAEQVKRGAGLYERRCASCHGDEIAQSFGGTASSAATIIETIVSMGMPQDNPGGLPKQDYTDIVAYIMNLHGLPEGVPVEAGAAELETIHLP